MKNILFLTLCFLLQGCFFSGKTDHLHVESDNEIVMSKGMEIVVRNNSGEIRIVAGEGFKRIYSWDGVTRSVVMIPRQKRWYGKLGLYFPGKGNHWKEHNGITRAVLEEAQLHFNSEEDALAFLKHPSRALATVYNDEGLAVTWSQTRNPSGGPGGVLFVDVWQIYIAGKKPIRLPGSENDNIRIVHKNRK